MNAGVHPRAYLFDAVQKLYKDRRQRSLDYWAGVKSCQLQEGERSHTHIIMAAAYGDKHSDHRGSAGTESPVGDPLDLAEEQLVSLAPSTPTTASLQLTTSEWAELWSGFLSQNRLPLDDAVQNLVWSICSGQVSCRMVDHNFACMYLMGPD